MQDASEASLRGSVVKRLELDDPKIDAIIKGLMAVAKLDDPINQTVSALEMDHGLEAVQSNLSDWSGRSNF